MSKEELAGLFGGSDNTVNDSFDSVSVSDGSPDWVDSGWAALGSADYNAEEGDRLNPSIRSKIIYSEFHDNLDSDWGRDEMIRYVNKNLEGHDEDDLTDFKIYLLDRLDSNKGRKKGELLGENVFQLIKEFDESEDRLGYLEDYSVS